MVCAENHVYEAERNSSLIGQVSLCSKNFQHSFMLKFVFQYLDAIKRKAYVMTWWEKLKTTKVIKVMTDTVIYHMEYGPIAQKIQR